MNKLKELYLSQNSATVLENNGVYTIEDLYEKAKQKLWWAETSHFINTDDRITIEKIYEDAPPTLEKTDLDFETTNKIFELAENFNKMEELIKRFSC